MSIAALPVLQPHRVELRPRFEGSNINTWIGFKHVVYMIEEAILETLRENGLVPRALFEDHGLCFEIVESDVRILTAYHMDDVAALTVTPAFAGKEPSELVFKVAGHVHRNGQDIKALSAVVRAVFKQDESVVDLPVFPVSLRPAVCAHIERNAPAPVPAGPAVAAPSLAAERGACGRDSVIATVVPADANAFVWRWRIPYFYCHYNDRLQHSGYLRLMEEAVDLFLADRGMSIRTMMDRQRWIPVVPHARISILREAEMEETLYTVYTVEEVFKATTYTSRVDWYVLRSGQLVQTATGRITHGYARIHDRREWSLVQFDQDTIARMANDRKPAAYEVAARAGQLERRTSLED